MALPMFGGSGQDGGIRRRTGIQKTTAQFIANPLDPSSTTLAPPSITHTPEVCTRKAGHHPFPSTKHSNQCTSISTLSQLKRSLPFKFEQFNALFILLIIIGEYSMLLRRL